MEICPATAVLRAAHTSGTHLYRPRDLLPLTFTPFPQLPTSAELSTRRARSQGPASSDAARSPIDQHAEAVPNRTRSKSAPRAVYRLKNGVVMAGPLSDAASRHPPMPPSPGAAADSSSGPGNTSPIYARFARPHEHRGSGLLFDTGRSASGRNTALLPSPPIKSFLRVDAPTPPPGSRPMDRTESYLSVDASTPPVSSGPQQTSFKAPSAIEVLKSHAAERQTDNSGTGVASIDVSSGDDR